MRLVRAAVIGLALSLAGCAASAASAQSECRTDADCVMATACCPGCCGCPRAVSRAEQARERERCAVIECDTIDCSHRSCRTCPAQRAVCESGACAAR